VHRVKKRCCSLEFPQANLLDWTGVDAMDRLQPVSSNSDPILARQLPPPLLCCRTGGFVQSVMCLHNGGEHSVETQGYPIEIHPPHSLVQDRKAVLLHFSVSVGDDA